MPVKVHGDAQRREHRQHLFEPESRFARFQLDEKARAHPGQSRQVDLLQPGRQRG